MARDGLDGADGRDGRDGKDGRDGVNGRDGAPGPVGPPGRDAAPANGFRVAIVREDFLVPGVGTVPLAVEMIATPL